MVRRHLRGWALLLIAAPAAIAQQQPFDGAKPAGLADCGSMVIIKCDRPTDASEQGRQQSRHVELRRQALPVQQLEGVVIESEAMRRRSIEDMMSRAFPAVLARDGNFTFDTGEGSKCTCMNVCPPFPFACCICSPRAGR